MLNDLIKKIAPVARNELQKDLIRALELEFERVENDIERYKELIFIPFFSEEQIIRFETFMNLEHRDGWTLNDRRERILYTLLSREIFTLASLKEKAKVFTNGEIEVIENFGDYSFIVEFTSIVGIPSNLDNFKEFINLNKPAHLGFKLKFRYNTHGDLEKHKLTHGQLSQYTYEEIRNKRLFDD